MRSTIHVPVVAVAPYLAVRYGICGISAAEESSSEPRANPINGNRNMNMSEPVVLIVGDDPLERDPTVRALAGEHYRIIHAGSSQEAMDRIVDGVDVVITELEWGQFNGLVLLRHGKSKRPQIAFILLTEGRDVGAAVEAMKLGALDCLVKPADPRELRDLVRTALQRPTPSGGSLRDQRSGKPSHIDIPPGTSLEDLERAAVEQALAEHHGNRTHAAKTLGISVRTLQRKLKAWGIPLGTAQAHTPRNNFVLTPPHANHSYSPQPH